ncbi:MAG: hypothetical protein J6V20_02785 [Bacteroidaceae bacterium]|nr:hypothetical protein [Bacteroidaceae bacterium]
MKADLCSKVSKISFYITMAVSLAIIALFFAVGFGNTETINNNDMRSPQFTDALLYWIYALTALAVILVLVFSLISFAKNFKDSPFGAMKSLGGILLLVVLFVISYFLASDEPIYVNGKPLSISDGTPIEASAYILTDVLIYVQYMLLAACTLATLFAMLNISKGVKKSK